MKKVIEIDFRKRRKKEEGGNFGSCLFQIGQNLSEVAEPEKRDALMNIIARAGNLPVGNSGVKVGDMMIVLSVSVRLSNIWETNPGSYSERNIMIRLEGLGEANAEELMDYLRNLDELKLSKDPSFYAAVVEALKGKNIFGRME